MAPRKHDAEQQSAMQETPKDEALDSSFLEENEVEGTGAENLEGEDFQRPKLILCQSGTPQRKKQNEELFIPGLEEGQFFNLISNEIYGGEIEVIPVFVGKPYAHEYDDQGKIVDYNIPLDDERLVGYRDEDGKYQRPTGKRHLDYTMLLASHDLQPVVWTAKGALRGAAKQMNTACTHKLRVGGKVIKHPPMFARAFVFTAGPSRGEHDNWVVNLGIPRLVNKREFRAAKELYDMLMKAEADRKADNSGAEDAEDAPPF